MTLHTDISSVSVAASTVEPFPKKPRRKKTKPSNYSEHAEHAALARMFADQRAAEVARKNARQETVDKILFHFRRGMSEAGLAARWGKDAVREAMEALENNRPSKAIKAA